MSMYADARQIALTYEKINGVSPNCQLTRLNAYPDETSC